MIRYHRKLSGAIVVSLSLLSSLADAADSDSSARLSLRSQEATASGQGDFVRANTWSRPGFAKGYVVAVDDGSMSTSSSIAFRAGSQTMQGSGFSLTIGRKGTSHGTSITRASGPNAELNLKGNSSQESAEQSARANGRNAQARNNVLNVPR